MRSQCPWLGKLWVAYRAASPRFQRLVIARLNSLDWHVLVPAEGGNDGGLVSEDNLVRWVGGEETLEKGDSRVEDDGTLTAGLSMHMDFMGVHEVGLHVRDV